MNQMLRKATSLQGSIRVPGDKSIAHRAMMLGAFSEGITIINGLPHSGDLQSTWECLARLGISLERNSNHTIRIRGLGAQALKAPVTSLPCGNSGTTLRLLMGLLAGQPIPINLDGDLSLCKRPMSRVADPLRAMGAWIQLTAQDTAPVQMLGKRPLQAISYSLPVASAQVKSALLFAGLFTDGVTTLTGKIQSRDHTERILPQFGIALRQQNLSDTSPASISITGGQKLMAASIDVPGDFSSAAFWIAAGLLIPGSDIEIHQVSLNPTRIGFLSALLRMGASINIEWMAKHPEPIGNLRVRSSALSGIEIDRSEIPFLIDELPILAIIASQAQGTTTVHGADELRHKESDRIDILAKNLRSMGGHIETFPDGFAVEGPTSLTGAFIHPDHDHRLAMAFSIAGLLAEGETIISQAECVAVSYPKFYEALKHLGYRG